MSETFKWHWTTPRDLIAATNVNTRAILPVDGVGTVAVQVINNGGGEWAYTIVFEASVDGVHFEDYFYGINRVTTTPESGCTDEGIWTFNVAGLHSLAFRLSVSSGQPEVQVVYGMSACPSAAPFCCAVA